MLSVSCPKPKYVQGGLWLLMLTQGPPGDENILLYKAIAQTNLLLSSMKMP